MILTRTDIKAHSAPANIKTIKCQPPAGGLARPTKKINKIDKMKEKKVTKGKKIQNENEGWQCVDY